MDHTRAIKGQMRNLQSNQPLHMTFIRLQKGVDAVEITAGMEAFRSIGVMKRM